MKNERVYLKNNVVLEPLIDNWYAWPHLVAPSTYGLNIKNRHLPILDSYIENPDIHAEAVKQPNMLGGPFMEFPKEKIDRVITHRKQLELDNAEVIKLADDLLRLNDLIVNHPKGACVDPLYRQIPDSLKGCVELFYDVNDNLGYRIFEPFLYRSSYYRKDAQSFKFYEIANDERTFVLSTPRIANEEFHLKIPFDDKRLDDLYKSVSSPGMFDELVSLLNIPEQDIPVFRSFFTTEAPPAYEKYHGDDFRLRYFGHACMLIETKDLSILIDPVISYDYDSYITRYTYKDLPDEIDYVLITHNHQDHILLETMLKIRHKVKNIVVPASSSYLQDPSLKHMLHYLGFRNIIALEEFEEINDQDFRIVGIPFLGEHSDLNIRCKLCYLVEMNQHKVFFAADTKNVSPEVYDRVVEMYGTVDILFLGLECDGAPLSWFYGPLLPKRPERQIDFSRTLAGSDYTEGFNIVKSLDPKHLYVYAMGQEPWLNYIMAIKYTDESRPIINAKKIINYCLENGKVAENLFGEKEISLNRSIRDEDFVATQDSDNNHTKITI